MLAITINYTTGKSVVAALQQITDAGVVGQWWNNTAGAWQTNPAETDRRITLGEGDSQTYSGGKSTSLGTYSGAVLIHCYEIVSGSPVKLGTVRGRLSVGNLVDGEGDACSVKADFDPSGRLELLLQSAANGGVIPTVSVVHVDRSRTWSIGSEPDDIVAQNVIRLRAGSECTLAVDVSKRLNDRTAIYSIQEVSVVPDVITLGTAAPSPDRKAVHFKVSDLVAGSYVITVVLNSTETGERLAVDCELVVE